MKRLILFLAIGLLLSYCTPSLSKQMKEKRDRVATLSLCIMDMHQPEKLRRSFYDTLVAIAPEVLKGCDLENWTVSTNIRLNKNVIEYRKQMNEKIELQLEKE
jgi:hypothetical protein